MNNEIHLDINDFGPIKKANININKLNVIAGVNGSGKSTSSKLLYCFLTATSGEGINLSNKNIFQRFINFIRGWLDRIIQSGDIDINDILNIIDVPIDFDDFKFNDEFKTRLKTLREIINNSEFRKKDEFLNDLKNIEDIFNRYQDRDYRYFNVSNSLLNSEFNFSRLKDYKNVRVHFHGDIDDCKFSHEIDFKGKEIGVKINEGYVNCLNFDDIIYIDSHSIYDLNYAFNSMGNTNKIPHHSRFLSDIATLQKDDFDVVDKDFYKKLDKISDYFKKLIGGHIYYDSLKKEFFFKKEDSVYSMKNTASGIKQIALISLLLNNRSLKENSFLIIDEVEVNLHPLWQLRLAQILILLVKELNIYLYINSHSPQLIEALEVYSAKYDLRDECSFYLSSDTNQEGFVFYNIPRDDLYVLYDNLGDPYDEIDDIRIENFVKNGISN